MGPSQSISEELSLLSLSQDKASGFTCMLILFLELIELIKREWRTDEMGFLIFSFTCIRAASRSGLLLSNGTSCDVEMFVICAVQCGRYLPRGTGEHFKRGQCG